MANTPVLVRYPSGQTLTLDLFQYGSDAPLATSLSLSEETNRKGLYRATVAGAISGWTTAHVLASGVPVAVYDLYLEDDTAEWWAHDAPIQLHQGTPNNAVTEVNLDALSSQSATVNGTFTLDEFDALKFSLWLEEGGKRLTDFNSDNVQTVTVTLEGRSASIPYPVTPTVDNARGLITGSDGAVIPDDEPIMGEVLVTLVSGKTFRGGIPIAKVATA